MVKLGYEEEKRGGAQEDGINYYRISCLLIRIGFIYIQLYFNKATIRWLSNGFGVS